MPDFETADALDFTAEAFTFAVSVSPGTYIRGTSQIDVLNQSTAKARVMLAGLEGNDVLRGGAGKDALNGGDGNDILSGGAGNDFITGGHGADRMAGGKGADTFSFENGDLQQRGLIDLIVDFEGAGIVGGDMLRFSGFGPGAKIDLMATTAHSHIYEVHDSAGASLGRLAISASGVPGAVLTEGDYVFL